MSHSLNARNGELGKNIRALTSILHRFDVQKSPSKQPRDILPFLRHLTTLLTCNDKRDNQARKVIAVTGTIDAAGQVWTLVVAQNQYGEESAESLSLELVNMSKKSFGEVVKSAPNATLHDHIAEVWAALSAFDPSPSKYEPHIVSLELFVLSRCYRTFVARFKEDKRLCGDKRLYEVIAEWRPDRAEIARKWVVPPMWLAKSEGLPSINSRRVGDKIQWEFSDDTKQAWAEVLEILLRKVDGAINQVKSVSGRPGKKAAEEVHEKMKHLNLCCRLLYYFIDWNEGIVKRLLTETNMVASITTVFTPVRGGGSTADEMDDDIAELRQEPDESKGQQVFRYLKTVVAWHAAVYKLTKDEKLPKILKNLEIGLVEVPHSSSDVLSLDQVSNTLFTRFPDMADIREGVLIELQQRYSNAFTGCVHAEATLMGLVNYYGHELTYASQGTTMKNTQNMRRIIQPVAAAGSAVITVSKKCCWCCDWLGQNLETKFKLPGTHGIMYPWDPPMVGVSVFALEKMEEVLWGELRRAISTAVETSYSRHSSAASSPMGMAVDEMLSSVLPA